MTTLRLVWADYRARYAHKREGRWRAAALAPPRVAGDPSLHATLLLRAMTAARPPLRGVLQRVLLATHAMYVDPSVEAGPGLNLPHPIAITLGPGVRLGAGVSLYQSVTVAPAPSGGGAPGIGDGAKLYVGAVVAGHVEVGAGAMVGAGVTVTEDVGDGGRAVRGHGALDGGDPVVGARRNGTAVPPLGRGLRAVLVADHAARFGGPEPGVLRLAAAAAGDRAFRVVAVMRLMHRSPGPLWRLWRRVLILHGCDVGIDAVIGPGFSVPCPPGVCVGRRSQFAAGVTLYEHTSAGPTRTEWQAVAGGPGLRLGHGTTLLPGSVAFGDIAVTGGAIVAPRAVVARDVGATAMAEPTDPGGPPPRPRREGLRALVRSDLRRLGPGGGTAPRRTVLSLPFQAAVLVRLGTSGRPGARVARALLRALHHCYVDGDVVIGPGLLLPYPCGIRLAAGAVLGRDVTVCDRVTVDARCVADGTVLGSGAVVLGAFTRSPPACDGSTT